MKQKVTKKLLLALLLVVISGANAFAQTQQETREIIKAVVSAMQERLPLDMNGLTLKSVAVKGNDIAFSAVIDEEYLDNDFASYKKRMTENKTQYLAVSAKNKEQFIKPVIEAGMNIKMTITGNKTGEHFSVVFTPDEMRQALEADYSARDLLTSTVEEMRKELPEDWGEGMSLADVVIDGNNFTYKIKTDGSVLTIGLLKYMKDENGGKDVTDSFIEALNEPSGAFEKMFIKYLLDSGFGLQYTFFDDKNESISFVVSPEELKEKVKVQSLAQ